MLYTPMRGLYVLVSIALYLLIGCTIMKVWERMDVLRGKTRINSGAGDLFPLFVIGWPVIPVSMLLVYFGSKFFDKLNQFEDWIDVKLDAILNRFIGNKSGK